MSKPTMSIEDQLHMSCALQDLGLCGCGTTEKWGILLLMLERATDRDKSFYDPIGDVPGAWVEFIAMVLDSHGFIEHGTSIGCAWLTPKGNAVLSFLRIYGTDQDEWPREVRDMTIGLRLPDGRIVEGDKNMAQKIRFDLLA